jgi:hypothetical protein
VPDDGGLQKNQKKIVLLLKNKELKQRQKADTCRIANK